MKKECLFLATTIFLANVAGAESASALDELVVLPAYAQAQARGMEFDVYIRLRKGMTEGEMLERAGAPDHQAVDGYARKSERVPRGDSEFSSITTNELISKTFYYYPTTKNPYTTVITTVGGRVTDVQRSRKF